MHHPRKRHLTIVLVLLLLPVLLGGIAFHQFTQPGPLPEAKTLIIPRGATSGVIAGTLAAEQVIAFPLVFRAAAVLSGKYKSLKAGEYAFPAGVSAREALEMLASGKTVLRRFTLVEGMTSLQAAQALAQETALTGEVPEHIPEGSLLPETYHFAYGDTRAGMMARMRAGMLEFSQDAWGRRAGNLPFKTLAEALVLASIVEKETGVAEERARVAAVFANRLRKGMKLQSDPTVVYAMERESGPLQRPLNLNDLQRDLPHNTYVIAGLPPTPICNPGKAAIEAVLHPAETDALYFVATGDGGHWFAHSLEEHNANVQRYRARIRQGKE